MTNKDHLSLAEQTFGRSVPYSHPALSRPNYSGSLFQNNFLTLPTVALVRIEFFPAGDFQRTGWTCLFSFDRFLPRYCFERYWSRKIIPFLSYVRLSCVWFSATHFKSRGPKTTLTIYRTWSAILLLVFSTWLLFIPPFPTGNWPLFTSKLENWV